MKLTLFSGLLLVTSISIFSCTFKLNQLRAVTLGLTRSTLLSSITVEEKSFTPRFIYEKSKHAIEQYFDHNVNSQIEYQLALQFINLDNNISVSDNTSNYIIVDVSALLLLNYRYQERVTISLVKQDA